jgi:YegS/Rv2252/BmrU family lipid kinase
VTDIAIILHGKRGANKVLLDFIAQAEEIPSFSVNIFYTKAQGHARELARNAKTADVIIASGGDGTLNEVVNGILESGNEQVRLIIIPTGTGNDFMRTRPCFSEADKIITQILSRNYRTLDVGVISSEGQNYFFLNIADAGFGGSTIHTLNRIRKVIDRKIAYPLAILKTFIRYRKPYIELNAGGFHYSGPALMAAFCNGSCFGNGIFIHPGADPSDGKLNITLLCKVSLFDYIRYLPKLKKGKRIQHPELHYLETTECSIKLLSGTMDIEADGEVVSLKDPDIRLLPGALRYIGPEN